MGVELEYVGEGRYVPGWPAADHYEEDDELAKAKLASGLYRRRRQLRREETEIAQERGETA